MVQLMSSSPDEVSRAFQADFRAASARFPTGVAVVTRKLPDGRAHGMTVSSFTSVSLHPPLILVCIDKRATFASALTPGMPFVVNVLAHEQQPLAARFAAMPEGQRFSGLHWHESSRGVPVLAGVVAVFECLLHDAVEAGDHWIVLGLVDSLHRHDGRPLVWCDSAYHYLPVDLPVGPPL